MATVRFYTRSEVDKLASVYVQFRDGSDIKLRVITPFRMYPSYWNEKLQRLKPNILFTEELTRDQAKDIEDRLTALKDAIQREHFKLSAPPSTDWLKGVVDKFYYKDAPKNETLRQYLNRFCEEAKAGVRLATVGTTKRRYSYETLRGMRGSVKSFEMFEDAAHRSSNFNDIDIAWYDAFVAFYYERGCSANYVGRHIKTLKTIMHMAREEGLHQNIDIDRKSFKVISEKVDPIYLTEDEVHRMFIKDLSDQPHLERARDIFLAGVYTAQRYSDYNRINKSMIKNGEIHLVQQKTNEKCIIPIKPELEIILKKYDYTLPKSHEQKVNLHIKTVGEKCEINDPIAIEEYKGGLKVKKTEPKYKLIRTHTARRTGITLMYLAGIEPIDIMKISAHRTEREFLKYVRVSKEQTSKRLKTHPYYSGNVLKVV